MSAEAGAKPASGLSAELVRAYRDTHYRVEAEPPFVLYVDRPCPGLAAWMAARDVRCAAFLTACNPQSRPQSPAHNALAQASLFRCLREAGWQALAGIGEHPGGGWPGEPSWFVPGLGLEEACRLGRRFDQNAIVWCGADGVPGLILLR